MQYVIHDDTSYVGEAPIQTTSEGVAIIGDAPLQAFYYKIPSALPVHKKDEDKIAHK